MTMLAPLLEAFFTEHLGGRRASPHTFAAYRDAFRLLLRFIHEHIGKAPSDLLLADVDASIVGTFLDHLEKKCGNSIRTRNARLAAIRSFFRFVAVREPSHAELIRRVLAIPQKKVDRDLVPVLSREEVEALLAAPDRASWIGRRDHLLLLLAVRTGLRVSELTGLRVDDCIFGAGAHVRCRGKGRKERCTPIDKPMSRLLRAWIAENDAPASAFIFQSHRGPSLSRDAVSHLVTRHAKKAASTCPSLQSRRVTPHVLRHTTAVHLLQSGVDRAVIALWLGHESVETTQMYLDADLKMKERALARTAPPEVGRLRYRPTDRLLAVLEAL